MIKLLLCAALVALCSGVGYLLAGKYKQRKKFFYELDFFNARMINEVSYTKMPLSAVIEKYPFSGDFGKLLEEKKKNGSVTGDFEIAYLSGDEKNFVRDYFLMVGRSDSGSQREYLNSARAETEKLRAESEKEYKRRFNLYVRLGFLFGLILAVLLA